MLYQDGLYEEALTYWNEVTKIDANYEMAHAGIGRALFHKQEYAEALPHLKLGNAPVAYSRAFRYVRTDFISEYFNLIAGTIVLLIVWVFTRKRIMGWAVKRFKIKKRERRLDSLRHVVFHPFDGFERIRRSKSLWVLLQATLVILFWFIAVIYEHQGTGFIFNTNRPNSLQVGYLFASTFGVTLLFCTLNWAVSTLTNGNGTIRRIWVTVSYSLLPYVTMLFLRALLSNVIIREEMVFLNILLYASMAWSFFLAFLGLRETHDYDSKQMLGNLLLTVAGIAIALFIFVLFGSLLQELINFVVGLYNEISFRMF
jgi:hypothetical protein